MPSGDPVKNLLARNVEEVIERGYLEAALKGAKKLRVKLGIDPTSELMHIGHAISLWKLREFQELGHKIVLIIGDFTAQIGDPSDKLNKRPFLGKEQVEKNLKNYLPQIGKIIDLKKTEIRYNSEWLAGLNFREISELADNFTFQQILERRNFAERLKNRQEISLREGLYPLMQGYDSVAVKADVEIGGTDQLFNLLAGRKIQERYGQKPQDILTLKMLVGLDGRKMSKTWGNVINILDLPDEQYGKIMSMRDEYIANYFEMATDVTLEEIAKIKAELEKGKNPKLLKEELAFEIVSRYHGKEVARKAAENFEKTFSEKEAPENVTVGQVSPDTTTAGTVAALMKISNSEARRLIEQGAVDIDGAVKKDPAEKFNFKGGELVKIGKKKFFRIKI